MEEQSHHPSRQTAAVTGVERRHTIPADDPAPVSVSVIVPFHANLHQLNRCLATLHPLPPRTEIIVAADRAPQECERVAWRNGARVVRVTGPGGPAAARNQAAMESRSDVLIFIDADVIVPSSALQAMARAFAADAAMAAVFGTYDDEPGCRNFFSQYRSLAQAYVQRSSGREARSFWAGFGGIRAEVFHSVGRFDEAFTRACIEDIELGDRVSAAGHRVLIDRRLHGCDLKRWTFRSMLASDIWDRGVPRTQLIFTSGRVQGLHVGAGPGISVAMCYVALLCTLLAFWQPILAAVAGLATAMVLFINRDLYVFFYKRRGASFAGRAALMNLLSHLYNGFSFALGAALFYTKRRVILPPPHAAADSSDRIAIR